jgi:HAD superfamily hydrolase (TIGR01459 family)
MTTLRFVERLRDLVDGVEVILSDIWGVVHNGLEAFPEACEALHTYRQRGGTVILITNAPRPADSVQRQLRKLGVADETYDAIVSSGDLTRHFVASHPGKKMFWVGPERDSSIHRGLNAVTAPLEQSDYIVCTGLFDDETETAEDYRAMLLQARERKLPLVCANPDIVVERGDRLIYCAGAIAELYRELGGEVIFYGKPHRPIYERAMALAAERRGHPPSLDRVLAIGDSVRTDLTGALGFGIDCLFVTLGARTVRPPAPRPDARAALVAQRKMPGLGPGILFTQNWNFTPSPCPGRPPRSWSSTWRR